MRAGSADQPPARLVPASFDDLDGFPIDQHLAAWRVLRRSIDAVSSGLPALRSGLSLSDRDRRALACLLEHEPSSDAAALEKLRSALRPYRIDAEAGGSGFLTGYYEPVVPGSFERTTSFTAPILARPRGGDHTGCPAAQQPGPTREAIETDAEAGGVPAIVWLKDWIEVFLIQVQGSGRVVLPDGRRLRLVYDGRNGQPYSSIGRMLIDQGEIPEAEMSLARLKAWIRRHGQAEGERGRALMWRNASYVFFRGEAEEPAAAGDGPIGGQGLRLEPLRSIAIDRTIWPYGLLYWMEADLPWRSARIEPFRRLLVGQDTGSAILGPARADLFFGTGEAAGERAGSIRHPCRLWVLLPHGTDLVSSPP